MQGLDMLSPYIKNLFNDKSLNMDQKMLAFLMFSDSKQLPDNPNFETHYDLGLKIKKLINENKIQINGFNNNFEILVSLF